MPEPNRPQPQHRPPAPPKPKQESCSEPVQQTPVFCPPPPEHPCTSCPKQQSCKHDSITGFFKQLLPKDMDTADLLIILLLLLMAGDCEDDRNNALLTLALYFFM